MGSKNGLTMKDAEHKILEPVVTDEMSEVTLQLEFRIPLSAEEVASRCGKTVEETEKILWDLAVAGVCFINEIDGVDK